MRSALRGTEVIPPADGWARLERELGPHPRISVLRSHWPRIAAAAAAVLIFLGGGGYLLHENRDLGDKGFVIATATDSGSSAADMAQVDGTPAGDGEGTLAGALRAAVPTEEAVRAAVAGQASATDGNPGEEAAGQAVQPRKYPGTYDYLADGVQEYRRPRRKTSVSLFAAGGVTGSSGASGGVGPNLVMSDIFVGGTNGTMAQLKYNYEDYSFRHHQPLSFGLSVRKEFAYGLSLESGVNYTLLWSDVSMQSGGEDISQKLHFIGVPLRLNWQFLETGRFSMYVGAGGMLEKCVSAKFGSKSVDEPKVQWSVAGAVGAQYRLGNYVGLYFEPEVSHYFTETTLRTSRTDSSLSLTLRLGVRLSF